jgi:CubicO group peptidase (beta-lactamase class C family)
MKGGCNELANQSSKRKLDKTKYFMKSKLTTLLALCFLWSIQGQQKTSLMVPSSAQLKTMLDNQKVPAVAVGIIENGNIISFSAEGKNHLNQSIDRHTIFDVASLTKTITTLVTLKLVENGDWNLEKSLSAYWIDPDVKNDKRHKQLNSKHVLAHQTGFLNWRWMSEDKKLSFQFSPGEKFGYSGEGYEYLRKALESKFDTSLEKLADSLVFEPLKMTKSSLVWHDAIEETNFAGNYDQEQKPYNYAKSYQANAADNLLTSLYDFTHLGKAIVNQGFLSASSFEKMIQPESNVKEGIDFGLGWILFNDLENDEYAIFNAGSDEGVNALILLFPKSKQGLVVLTNGDNGRRMAMGLIAQVFGDRGKEILGKF